MLSHKVWWSFADVVSGVCSVAWVAFTCCMSSGVSTLNNYTKKFLMVGPKHKSVFYPCRNFTFPPQSPSLSPLSPYFSPPLLPPPPPRPAPLSPCPATLSHNPAPPLHSPASLSLLELPVSPPVTLLLSPLSFVSHCSDEEFSPL